MPIDDLIADIQREVAGEAEQVVARAGDEARRILGAAESEALAAAERERSEAVTRCTREVSQYVSQARLEARNRLLDVEQSLVDEVLEAVHEKLLAMDDAAYRGWMTRQIAAVARDPAEKVIVGSDDRVRLDASWRQEVEQALQEGGGPVGIQIEFASEPMGGGFIVRHPRYDVDVTFGKLLESLRTERRSDVARVLLES